MNGEALKKYLIYTMTLLKNQALKARKIANTVKDKSKDYHQGMLMGYYSIIRLLKHQAFTFCIHQRELGLADIQPDRDLLGLSSPPEDLEKDNRAEPLTSAKIKGYLIDSINLLIEQALEIQKGLNNADEYTKGELKAYDIFMQLMEEQARIFGIDRHIIGLKEKKL